MPSTDSTGYNPPGRGNCPVEPLQMMQGYDMAEANPNTGADMEDASPVPPRLCP